MSVVAGRSLLRSATRAPALRSGLQRSSFAQLRQSQIRPFSSTMTVGSGAPTTTPNQPYDKEIVDIASYVHNYDIKSDLAIDTARFILLDTIGCGLKALEFEECTKLLGPVVPKQSTPNGARVPGTPYELDPLRAAFSFGAAIRWLDCMSYPPLVMITTLTGQSQ